MDNCYLNDFYTGDLATLCWPEDSLRRDNETVIRAYSDSVRVTFGDIMIQCGPFRCVESPPSFTKDRMSIAMETHSNQSYDGTGTLPLLDDYRLDEKDISSNLGSPTHPADWNNSSKPRAGAGKRAVSDKGRPGKCKVCGDLATGMYFGALVCVPCKTFFLRYEGDNFNFVCKGNKDCEITMATRTQCKYCRYQKCREAGMVRRVRPAHVNLNEGQQLCVVCHDVANGIHFGAVTCEGCKKFFRRGLSEHSQYSCKNGQNCVINPRTRNSCRFCRYKTCLSVGMSREAIQMGRPSKLAMESSGIQRGLRTVNANSGTVGNDLNASNRQFVAASAGRLKEMTSQHYLMGNQHPKQEPSAWDWQMDQTVIGHSYHPDIGNFAGQMTNVCDFLDSPTKNVVGMDGYASPHLGSGLLTPSCSSTGGDHNSSNSCLSLISSASPEGIHYGNRGWSELGAEASKPVPLNVLYHNSGGSIHHVTPSPYQPCTTSSQEVYSNHTLSKLYHEKTNIPQPMNGSTGDPLHFSPNSINLQQPLKLGHFEMSQPSKLGQFDIVQSSKMEHYDQQGPQIQQYKDVKDVLDSLLDVPCQPMEHSGNYNQLEHFNLKYGATASFMNSPPDQQQMTSKNRNVPENRTMMSFSSGQQPADVKKIDPEFVTLTNIGSVDESRMHFTPTKTSHLAKQSGNGCFTTTNEALSSSTTTGLLLLTPSDPAKQPLFDAHSSTDPSIGNKVSPSKCLTPAQNTSNEVSAGVARSAPKDDAVVPRISVSGDTKVSLNSIAEWVFQLQQNYVDNNEKEFKADELSDELTKMCKGLYIDGISFVEQNEKSTHYWKSQELPDENIMVGAEHWRLFNHFHPLYANYVSLGSTWNHNLRIKFEQWQSSNEEATDDEVVADWVKENVFPVYTDLTYAYFSQIQGFKSFDIEDQRILLRLAQSQSRILAAALAWFNPDTQNFTDFLPWREPKPDQVDLFKQHLIDYAKAIQSRNLDPVESALFNIVVVIATDYPGFVRPEIIESYRTQFLATFRAYTTAKYGTPNKRMEKLFQLVPQLRRLGHLHYAMTQTPNLGITSATSKEM